MSNMLRDLYAHQEWADAEHWRAFEAFPASLDDHALQERLHHIHLVQQAFLWACRGDEGPFTFSEAKDFTTPASLREFGRQGHRELTRLLDDLTPARLGERCTIPWFRDPPLAITVEEALTQAAMHSHYHRGQNAARLRELGGEPPLTDYIFWLWKGRPPAAWS
jgi:uncharacterized damage-inducible protein DinB